ncbi:MAG: glycosyltransferase family 39 protein [Actinomycetes bacterium]
MKGALRRLAYSSWVWAPLAVAVVVRLPAITQTVPYIYYVDSPQIIQAAAGMANRLPSVASLDPAFYLYGSLPIYLAFGISSLFVFLRAASDPSIGIVHPFSAQPSFTYSMANPTVINPSAVVTVELLTWIAIGCLTVLFASLAARTLAGRTAGFCAGIALAAFPWHATMSTSINVDLIATFLTCVLALVTARWVMTPGPRDHLYAGALVGLVFATKYNAAICAIAPAVVLIARKPEVGLRVTLRQAGLGILTALVAAVIAMPALVIRLPKVMAALASLRAEYYSGESLSPAGWPNFITQWHSFTSGVGGWLVLTLIGASIACALYSRSWRVWALAWLIFVVVSVAMLTFQSQTFHRNLLPTYPIAAIYLGLGAAALLKTLRPLWRFPRTPRGATQKAALTSIVVVTLVVLLFAPTLRSDFTTVRDAGSMVDNRSKATSWLRDTACTAPGDGRIIVATETLIDPAELPDQCGHPLSMRSLTDSQTFTSGDIVLIPQAIAVPEWVASYPEFARPVMAEQASLTELLPRLDQLALFPGGPATQYARTPDIGGTIGPGLIAGRVRN